MLQGRGAVKEKKRGGWIDRFSKKSTILIIKIFTRVSLLFSVFQARKHKPTPTKETMNWNTTLRALLAALVFTLATASGQSAVVTHVTTIELDVEDADVQIHQVDLEFAFDEKACYWDDVFKTITLVVDDEEYSTIMVSTTQPEYVYLETESLEDIVFDEIMSYVNGIQYVDHAWSYPEQLMIHFEDANNLFDVHPVIIDIVLTRISEFAPTTGLCPGVQSVRVQIPEPASSILIGLGLTSFLLRRHRN